MKQKVVIIGHGYTSRLAIIRSLAALDCEITVIAMVFQGRLGRYLHFNGGKPVDCHSKYVSRVLYCPAQNGEALVRLLLSRCTDPEQKVIIIPDSDTSASVIDNNQERLKKHFLFPHIHHTPGEVEHWMHKTTQKKLATEIGLNVTQDTTITIKDDRYSLPEGIRYPCFTKPLATISGGKQFLKRCDNEVELRKVLDKASLQFHNTDVLVEDFKVIETEYAVVGFSDGKDVVIPGVIEFIVNSKSHFGIAREGKIMPVTGFESLLEQFKEFVRRVGFYGLFDIDFYESDGKMYFGEMNLRFGGSGYAYTAMGANLPAMLVESLQGKDYSHLLHNIDCTATYANERMCLDDFVAGHISRNEYEQILAAADIRFVYDTDDYKPNRFFYCYMRVLQLNRLRKKLRKQFKKIKK